MESFTTKIKDSYFYVYNILVGMKVHSQEIADLLQTDKDFCLIGFISILLPLSALGLLFTNWFLLTLAMILNSTLIGVYVIRKLELDSLMDIYLLVMTVALSVFCLFMIPESVPIFPFFMLIYPSFVQFITNNIFLSVICLILQFQIFEHQNFEKSIEAIMLQLESSPQFNQNIILPQLELFISQLNSACFYVSIIAISIISVSNLSQQRSIKRVLGADSMILENELADNY